MTRVAVKAILALEHESEVVSYLARNGISLEVIYATSPTNALDLLEAKCDQIDCIILNAHLCEIGNSPVAKAAIAAIFKAFAGKIIITCGQPEPLRVFSLLSETVLHR